jgi:DNA-directed RNA polymerase subunit RPC12/RpoP
LWSGCDFFPEEQQEIACAYCESSIGEFREEGIDSVEIYWIEKENLRLLDIPSWQKDVLLLPEDIYLCLRCGKPFPMLGWAFFLDGTTPYDIRLKWLRAAVELLASKLLRAQQHTEYEQDTGFRSPGHKKDTRPPLPGSLALDAWNQISKECPEE